MADKAGNKLQSLHRLFRRPTNKALGKGVLDKGLQKLFSGKGGSLSVVLVDAFNSAGWMDWDFTQKKYSVRTYSVMQFSQRHVRLDDTHPFGNQKVKSAKKRSTASEEERRRAGS